METITTLATIPAILALVNLLKAQGLGSKHAMLAAVILGIALNIADFYLGAYGGFQAASTGLVLGLGAAGLYDVTHVPSDEPRFELAEIAPFSLPRHVVVYISPSRDVIQVHVVGRDATEMFIHRDQSIESIVSSLLLLDDPQTTFHVPHDTALVVGEALESNGSRVAYYAPKPGNPA